jgi:hypothetical protein
MPPANPFTPPAASYVDVRYPDGKLAFRFDAGRGIVEIAQRGTLHYFDLAIAGKDAIDNSANLCYTLRN